VNRSFASLISPAPASGRPGRPRFAGADIALAAFVVLVVGLMIVPLPTALLDVLLATNLSASIAILLVVLYAGDAISIATFPTVLLLTTLFRLSLNVASTRLILLQADAGQVIRAFGTFVVRGNYVVGGVVFLVLTIIQFVVVAKGSERVAEVGARFALDAMPGKQMAIDAELRGGSIDGAEAKRRRRLLQRESQFYGAMDGAMKFVKGDVISSLVILVVNLVGGLTIGVLMKGTSVVDALRRYGLLTIGDGLVTQIPALVLSTAAGVLVTRVASEEADTPLGEELAKQLFGVPRALQVAGVFVLILAAVPGLPGFPFAILAVALLAVGRARARAQEEQEARASTEPAGHGRPAAAGASGQRAFVPMVVPWSVEVSADLATVLDRPAGGFRAMALGLREVLFSELGVPLPLPRVRLREDLASRQVLLSVHEVPAQLIVVPAEVPDEQTVERVRAEVLALLRARAADFVGLAETQRLLDELEPYAPATVRNVVPRPVSLATLADVLRRLLEERVSIRDLRAVLEALATVAASEKDPLGLAEHVRSQMRRAITFRLTGGAGEVGVVLLDPVLEDTVRRAITKTPAGAFLALPPQASRDVRASLRRALEPLVAMAGSGGDPLPPCILTQPDIRRFVRKVIETDWPEVWVVTFAELLPELAIRPVGRAVP
jgi:type III secretion protein V